MATLTISLSGSAIVNGSRAWTVSDADVQTLINYMISKFSPDPGAGQGPPLTQGQALSAWVQDFVSRTVAEIQLATKQGQVAALVVPPLTFT